MKQLILIQIWKLILDYYDKPIAEFEKIASISLNNSTTIDKNRNKSKN